jgi:integrase
VVPDGLLKNSAFDDYTMREWNIHLPKGNPFDKLSLPLKGKARDRRLISGEFEIIKREAEAYGGYIGIVFELAVETAMRRGEIISLCWKHINLEKRTAFLPETKNGSSRTVPLSLRDNPVVYWVGTDERVFPINGDSVGKAF